MKLSLVCNGAHYPIDAIPLDLLSEQRHYRLRLEHEAVDPDLDAYRATVGEVPLELVYARASGGQVRLEWEWSPDFFTGEFSVMIHYQGERLYPPQHDERRLLVRPDVHKLTRQYYEAMVGDLMQWTAGWLTPSPGQWQGASTARPLDSPLAQLELLHWAWATVERLVTAVVERPWRCRKISLSSPCSPMCGRG